MWNKAPRCFSRVPFKSRILNKFNSAAFCVLQRQGVVPALRAGSEQSQVQNWRSRVPAPDRRDTGQRARLLDRVPRPQVLGSMLLGYLSRPPVADAGCCGADSADFGRRKVKNQNWNSTSSGGATRARLWMVQALIAEGKLSFHWWMKVSLYFRLLFASCGTTFYRP